MPLSDDEEQALVNSAYDVLRRATLSFEGQTVGYAAAVGDGWLSADNYRHCFVRDFVPAALVCLADGDLSTTKGFLRTVLSVISSDCSMASHRIHKGIVPASFHVEQHEDGERLASDFGDRSIGRVAPVDALLWFVILLGIYTRVSGDRTIVEDARCRGQLEAMLRLCLEGSFEIFPTLLVPDGAFMVDRRMGVYGHPLEVQVLLLRMLRTVTVLLGDDADAGADADADEALIATARHRIDALQTYLGAEYWLDAERLSEIYRSDTEQLGRDVFNALNIHPDGIPPWLIDWLPGEGGYFVGNLGPQRIDFRFFSYGNLLAVLFGAASESQASALMQLVDRRWEDLMGVMPMKLCFPALKHGEWQLITGGDPKNRPWCYHNGGHWPMLLWAFVAAALIGGRRDLAERALESAQPSLAHALWPEYYDGRRGQLIGRYANLEQTWSAAGYLWANKLMREPRLLDMFDLQALENAMQR